MLKIVKPVNAVHFMMVTEEGSYRFLNQADDYDSARAELEKIAIDDFKNSHLDTSALSYVLIDWANNFSEVFVFDFSVQVNINAFRS